MANELNDSGMGSNSDSDGDETSALPEGAFEGREAFTRLLHTAMAAASARGWLELVFCDADFSDWPLGERAFAQALQDWAGAGRRFVLVAERFDMFARGHARFVDWRRRWDHLIECRVCHGPGAPSVPSAIWSPEWSLHRVDPVFSRGIAILDAARRNALRERIDECLRQGRVAFAASTLGL